MQANSIAQSLLGTSGRRKGACAASEPPKAPCLKYHQPAAAQPYQDAIEGGKDECPAWLVDRLAKLLVLDYNITDRQRVLAHKARQRSGAVAQG